MLSYFTYAADFGLAIPVALSMIFAVIWKQQSAVRSLQWPAGSPLQFIRLCQRRLEQRGWTVERKIGSYFDLVAKQDGTEVRISCRPSNFGVSAAYLRDVRTWRIRSGLPVVVAITYDQIDPVQRAEAARARVLLICYKEVDSLAAQLRCFQSRSLVS
jgi:hypothetical protein